MSMNDIISLAWGAKEILRSDFKKTEWGKIILPFIVLRRIGRVLEPTRNDVIKELEKLKDQDSKSEYVQKRLNKISGQNFHNQSEFNLNNLLDAPNSLERNFLKYIRKFSENIEDVFTNFDFETSISKLEKHGILFPMVEQFASSKLDFDPNKIDNHTMGTIYEEVIRRVNESNNEEAGEHFTPREVIRLMVKLLFVNEKKSPDSKGKIKTIYDPAAGTGGMLSVASDELAKINPDLIVDVFGQEINAETFAVCKSDMLIRGLDLDRIKEGNSLIMGQKGDGFANEKFHYMLSNPPFGVDWGKYEKGIRDEEEKGFKGKYGPGTPRKSDGSLLFLLHMISKMRPKEEGGSRIAIVLNGSPLFTGEAKSGESEIRKWIIENDMLETIIGLPGSLFYNTGILTYIWIVTNNKDSKRKGKIQLIDASGEEFYSKMKTSLGDKRNEINDEQIDSITEIYKSFTQGKYSKIFDNDDFGYHRITVERPLRRNFQVTSERLDKLKEENAFQKLDVPSKAKNNTKNTKTKTNSKPKPVKAKSEDVLKILSQFPKKVFTDYEEFSKLIEDGFDKNGFSTPSDSIKKTILKSLSEKDDSGSIEKDKKGKTVSDSDLRDYENIPLKDDIDKYFQKEVKPFVSDAWIDDSTRDTIGYEIPFTRHFYVYKPLRSVEEIDSEIKKLQKEISQDLGDLMK